MPQYNMTAAIGQLDSLLRAGSMAGLSDAELLDRVIATDRDVASGRWLMSSTGTSSLGKPILAIGLIALGAGFVAGGSGSESRRTAARAETGRALRQNLPSNSGAPANSEKRQSQLAASNSPGKNPAQALPRASLVSLLDQARRSAADLKDARTQARMLLAVATAYSKLDDRTTARAVFQQAVQSAMAIQGQNRIYTLEDIAAAQIDGDGRDAAVTTIRRAFGTDRDDAEST